jgi:NADH-quinone oxidoreductase subunit L
MPITTITFGLGYLAILGVPPFAGFYSKDKIIATAFNTHGAEGIIIGTAALLGAGITAFYMTRVVVMTFTGQPRFDDELHPHESPILMWLPMAILAIGSVSAGFLLSWGSALVNWLAPIVNSNGVSANPDRFSPLGLSIITLVVVGIGVGWAVIKYRTVPMEAPSKVSIFTKAARKDLYQDAFNEAVLMKPGIVLTQTVQATDDNLIDGGVRGIGALVTGLSKGIRKIQNGYVRSYALLMSIGILLLLATVWLVNA